MMNGSSSSSRDRYYTYNNSRVQPLPRYVWGAFRSPVDDLNITITIYRYRRRTSFAGWAWFLDAIFCRRVWSIARAPLPR